MFVARVVVPVDCHIGSRSTATGPELLLSHNLDCTVLYLNTNGGRVVLLFFSHGVKIALFVMLIGRRGIRNHVVEFRRNGIGAETRQTFGDVASAHADGDK